MSFGVTLDARSAPFRRTVPHNGRRSRSIRCALTTLFLDATLGRFPVHDEEFERENPNSKSLNGFLRAGNELLRCSCEKSCGYVPFQLVSERA